MILEISSSFSLLESSPNSVWKLDGFEIESDSSLSPEPDLSFSSPVAVGLRRRLLAPLKAPPVSPLPVATFAFASRRP